MKTTNLTHTLNMENVIFPATFFDPTLFDASNVSTIPALPESENQYHRMLNDINILRDAAVSKMDENQTSIMLPDSGTLYIRTFNNGNVVEETFYLTNSYLKTIYTVTETDFYISSINDDMVIAKKINIESGHTESRIFYKREDGYDFHRIMVSE